MKEDNRMHTSATIAHAWVAAVNAQAPDRLAVLSSPGIEIVGPRGAVRGVAVLRDGLLRAGLLLETTRTFARDPHVVMAHRGTWRTPGTTAVSSADVASRFDIQDGRMTGVDKNSKWRGSLAVGTITLSRGNGIDRKREFVSVEEVG